MFKKKKDRRRLFSPLKKKIITSCRIPQSPEAVATAPSQSTYFFTLLQTAGNLLKQVYYVCTHMVQKSSMCSVVYKAGSENM